MKDKTEEFILILTVFFLGVLIGIWGGMILAQHNPPSDGISLNEVLPTKIYTLYDGHGEIVGYEMIDFEGIYYSNDGCNWNSEPIMYVRKEEKK